MKEDYHLENVHIKEENVKEDTLTPQHSSLHSQWQNENEVFLKQETDLSITSEADLSLPIKEEINNKDSCCERNNLSETNELTSDPKRNRFEHEDSCEILTCSSCFYQTKSKENLRTHFRRHHSENIVVMKCELCQYKTKRSDHLTRHIRMKHDNCEPFKCKLCNYRTKLKYQLKRHVKMKHNGKCDIMECAFGEHRTKRKSDLIRLVKMKHNNNCKVLNCHLCDYSTKLKNKLKVHVAVKHERVITNYDMEANVEDLTCEVLKLKKHVLAEIIVNKRIPDSVGVSEALRNHVNGCAGLPGESVSNLQSDKEVLQLRCELKVSQIELTCARKLITSLEKTVNDKECIINLMQLHEKQNSTET